MKNTGIYNQDLKPGQAYFEINEIYLILKIVDIPKGKFITYLNSKKINNLSSPNNLPFFWMLGI